MKKRKEHYLRIMFPELNYPQYKLKITKRAERYYVWDDLRKKELLLTPEEWVRQHVIHYMIEELGYPKGRIVSEMTIVQNGMSKRCDIVVFNEEGRAVLIVECKETRVPIDQDTFFQIARYNASLQVPHLVMTNGLDTVVCEMQDEIVFKETFPEIN
jgi:hypothetical protein